MSCSIWARILATLPEDVHPKQARITAAESEQLEREIDRMNEGLAAAAIVRAARRLAAQRRAAHLPDGLPARGTRAALRLAAHERRWMRQILKYLNRLSDALFVWSRWASHQLGVPEILWEPNQAASQSVTIGDMIYAESDTIATAHFRTHLLSALGRLVPHAPNVTPLGGSCLFAGSRISGFWAYLLPLAVMIATDPIVGHAGGASSGYTWGSPVIYACFMINVWIGRRMLRSVTPVRVGAAAFLCSLQFFVLTNLALWVDGGRPARSVSTPPISAVSCLLHRWRCPSGAARWPAICSFPALCSACTSC